jgi:DNA-binding protein H-NS
MKNEHFESMSTEELWNFYQEISINLAKRIKAEKAALEERLRKIEGAGRSIKLHDRRRPYPPVLPKYRNPKNPSETWSGRGKQPRWLAKQLLAGSKLDDFLIGHLPGQKQRRNG